MRTRGGVSQVHGAAMPVLRFDRNELAGAFGDVGTSIPLIILLLTVPIGLDPRSVMMIFGACLVFSGLAYRLPIPVQPMKAMATIAIASHGIGAGEAVTAGMLAAAGLISGAVMGALSLSGALTFAARLVPKAVIRGIQFGLGMKLAIILGLQKYLHQGGSGYIFADGMDGYVLAAAAAVIVLMLYGNRRFPAALFVIAIGVVYVFASPRGWDIATSGLDPGLPRFTSPAAADFLPALLILAIPQLPLSLGNAVLATSRTVSDLFPGRTVGVGKLGLTYSLLNLLAPWLGGIPVCNGSGGVAGYHTFGARTGGSVIIYGALFLVLGGLFGSGFFAFVQAFPRPLLAVLLVFEGLAMMRLSADMASDKTGFFIVLLVGLLGAGVRYGFLIGLVGGTALHYGLAWRRRRA